MSDQQARNEALDTTQSFIVQAPAGSGKTTLLTSRFISLLEIVEQPEEILAMTFTRKATAEMRERILGVLNPDSNVTLPQKEANLAAQRVRKRSVELGWDLHIHPSRLQIMTIDALATGLVRCMPWASRFGSVPGIIENTDDVYAVAAANTIESASSDSGEFRIAMNILHGQLDNSSQKLQNLIVEMLAKRDQWLRILFQNTFTNSDKSRMENFWRLFLAAELNELQSMFPPGAQKILGLDALDNTATDALERWGEIANSLLTKTAKWYSRIPNNPFVQQTGKDMIQLAIKECTLVPRLDVKLNQMGRLAPDPVYDDRQWEVLQAATVVLQMSVAQLKLEFRKRGSVDYIEISQQAGEALGTPENPTDLSLVLDYRYKHILVDEFQDASINQHNLLKSLTGGWQPDDGHTLFLVGDPMQSIYRFREAEVGIYLSVLERGLGNIKPKALRLHQNFRSSSNLVNWFNTVFQSSFPEDSDVMSGRVTYSPCNSDIASGSSNPVSIWLQHPKAQDGTSWASQQLFKAEAQKLVEDVGQYLKRNSDCSKKVAVLIRGRRHVEELLPLMEKNQIRYYAADLFPLAERPVVIDILSLTRSLLNLADRTSWLALLRAPWCGLTLDDLLVVAGDGWSSIWSRLNEQNVIDDLSDDGRSRVIRIREVLKKAISIRGRFELRQWIEDTWVLLGGPACVTHYDNENARLFLDLLENHAKGTGVENLESFEEQMKSLYAVPECSPDEASVHIMTIHGAKGLEYDAVFIPSIHRTTGRSSSPLMVWSEVLLQKLGSELLISPISDAGATENDKMYDFLKMWNAEKDLMELTRLTYVACTRAKDELYVYGVYNYDWEAPNPSDLPPSGTLLRTLWPGLVANKFQFVNWAALVFAQNVGVSAAPGTVPAPILSRLPGDWVPPLPPEPLNLPNREFESPGNQESIDFDWAGSVAVWTGIIVHKWLYRIVQSGIENWDLDRLSKERPKWNAALLALGMSADGDEINKALLRIEKALRNVFEDSTGLWLLGSHHQEEQAEFRMTGYVDGVFKNVILDRTFVDDSGIRWIVDYKTGSTLGNVNDFLDNEVQRYRGQLKQYERIFSGFDSRPIKLGLYFPMFPAWREVES